MSLCQSCYVVYVASMNQALFITNRHFIGFLHKQNKAASTQINLLSLIHVLGLDETWREALLTI